MSLILHSVAAMQLCAGCTLEFEPQDTLGAAADPAGVGVFADVLRIGDQGYLVSSEAVDGVVIIYDSEGRYQRELNRVGDGPGEFSISPKFAKSGSGILMHEWRSPRLHLWSAERSRSDARRQLPWEFESVWRISSLTHESLAASTFPSKNVDADAAGNVYLLDQTAQTVFVISPDGELIDSLGRTGSGPGEFCNAVALDVTADSILAVADYCGDRLVRWRVPDAQLLDPVQLKGAFNFAGLVRTLSDGFIATEMEGSSGNQYAFHVTRSTSAGTERVFLGRMSPRNRFAPCGRSMSYPKLFEPRISWDYRDRVLAVAEDSAYVIHVFKEGNPPVRIEKKDVLPRPVTASMARRELGGMAIWAQVIDQCGVTTNQVLDGLGYTRYLQAVADVRVSPSGEVWALRAGTHDELREIDVFSRTGEHLGTLPPDSPFPAAFAPPDRIVAIGLDEFGPTLTAYRMSR